jgi:hypothetical protein
MNGTADNPANMRRIASDKAAQITRTMRLEARRFDGSGEVSVGYRRLFWLACGALGALSFVWGSFAVLLADLSRFLDLSPGQLGLALSGGMVVSIPVMVLAGRVADRVGRRPLLIVSGGVNAGSFIHIPKGTLHCFKNVGATTARMLALFTPGGFEGFFFEVGQPAIEGETAPPPGPEEIEKTIAVAPQYGMEVPPPPGT